VAPERSGVQLLTRIPIRSDLTYMRISFGGLGAGGQGSGRLGSGGPVPAGWVLAARFQRAGAGRQAFWGRGAVSALAGRPGKATVLPRQNAARRAAVRTCSAPNCLIEAELSATRPR
jgi:hypothetical protein